MNNRLSRQRNLMKEQVRHLFYDVGWTRLMIQRYFNINEKTVRTYLMSEEQYHVFLAKESVYKRKKKVA
jgi:hypothetical protein